MLCKPDLSGGKLSCHFPSQASRGALGQREGAHPTLDCSAPWRGGASTGSGAFRQPGPDQPCTQAVGDGRKAGEDWHGRVRQSGAWANLWYPDGAPDARSVGRRNLREAGHPLAAGGSATPLQRAAHHPGALAHHVRHRQTAHQPPPADRQEGGGVCKRSHPPSATTSCTLVAQELQCGHEGCQIGGLSRMD